MGPHGRSVLDFAIVHKEAKADMCVERLDYLGKAFHNALIVGLYEKQHQTVERTGTALMANDI